MVARAVRPKRCGLAPCHHRVIKFSSWQNTKIDLKSGAGIDQVHDSSVARDLDHSLRTSIKPRRQLVGHDTSLLGGFPAGGGARSRQAPKPVIDAGGVREGAAVRLLGDAFTPTRLEGFVVTGGSKAY